MNYGAFLDAKRVAQQPSYSTTSGVRLRDDWDWMEERLRKAHLNVAVRSIRFQDTCDALRDIAEGEALLSTVEVEPLYAE